jgi:hypothetical protein
VEDALIDTWNDLHGFKEWRKVEVDLAMAAEFAVLGSRRKRPRKYLERPKRGWF